MRTTVHVLNNEATVDQGVWQCANPTIQKILQNTVQADDEAFHPDPDAALAHGAVKQYGGRVVSAGTPRLDPDVQY